jgi:3-deoxy-D-manno-octulosonate 8-phosphate phosphatase (KDO 8-P phosphatase)
VSKEIVQLFESGGGEFFTPPSVFVAKLRSIRAVLFDWDGVFNEGFKQGAEGSVFSEVDAMGTNMLRYALWKLHGKQPFTAIITGEENPSAQGLSKREHFHAMYFQAKNKAAVFASFCQRHSVRAEEILFFYDDVLDLEVARQCGARIMIGRKAAPMLAAFAKSNSMVDYVTGCSGGEHGLREGCELIVALLGQYDAVVSERMVFSSDYQLYLAERQEINVVVEAGLGNS